MQAINGMNAVLQRVRGKTEPRRNTTGVSSCDRFPGNGEAIFFVVFGERITYETVY